MRTLLYTVFAFCFSSISAQNAVNFTVEETNGNNIELYDLLDEGKTVVLEFMFTSCPPCNSFASYTEMIYKDWGRGDFDVEFITMTTQPNDTQTDIAAWQQQYGHTFPGVGANGGSLEVVNAYTDGTYGAWWGPPTFIVIAPDKSVNFNVGSGTSGAVKVMKINQAIAATGAVKPPVIVKANGKIETVFGEAINGVTIGYTQTNSQLDTTGTDGLFNFNQELPQDSLHTVIVEKEDNPLNGVTTYDMVLIAKHILAVKPFGNPYDELAADVNLSGTVTTVDLVKLRKLILFIEDDMEKSWRFVSADCDLNNETCGLDEVIEFDPADGHLKDLDIIGIKMGDVNHSASPENLDGADDRNSDGELSFRIPNQKLTAGDEISVAFTSNDFNQISAFQYTLDFQIQSLQFIDYQSNTLNFTNENFNTQLLENGQLTTQWYDIEEQTYDADEVLFTLIFKALENAELKDVLNINSELTTAEAFDGNGRGLDLNLEFDEIKKSSFFVFPNPTQADLNVDLNLENSGEISFEIYNAVGQIQSVIFREDLNENQNHKITLATQNLAPNIYFLKIKNGTEVIDVQRFVKK